MADQYSVMMKSMIDEMFLGGKQRAISLTDGEFLTYCQVNESSCAFLVHVPQLRQYKGEVRDALSSLPGLLPEPLRLSQDSLKTQDLELASVEPFSMDL